ncbi:mitochondria fission 1 protein [Nadsonia fulvescens var. elongata DSM 6958]|uniref:Mitochondrial fission 1 protein n=1 Tax=Nadsonia fulvescens var. elongata DSM 6958 TaxID=857566 RepID=A0A1E3PIT6_9ASCO|nr:mitochondria fission 1 protein [Nadsonia fulvescens var. elongata DSM 6958]
MSSNTYLPELAQAEAPLSDEELGILRKQYLDEGDYVCVQTKFNYSWGLIKSLSNDDQQLGVRLLTEVFKDNPNRRRECLYYLSMGNFKLGDFTTARKYCDILLSKEPRNAQAIRLRQMIEDRLAKEGLIGVAIIGGVVAVGATVLGVLMRHRRN